jgi:hypothetical protein
MVATRTACPGVSVAAVPTDQTGRPAGTMEAEGTGRPRGTRRKAATGGSEAQVPMAAVIQVRDPARLMRRATPSLPESRLRATPPGRAARAGGAAGGDVPRKMTMASCCSVRAKCRHAISGSASRGARVCAPRVPSPRTVTRRAADRPTVARRTGRRRTEGHPAAPPGTALRRTAVPRLAASISTGCRTAAGSRAARTACIVHPARRRIRGAGPARFRARDPKDQA